jgi:hypothetical protein
MKLNLTVAGSEPDPQFEEAIGVGLHAFHTLALRTPNATWTKEDTYGHHSDLSSNPP